MADEDESRRKRVKISNDDSASEPITAPIREQFADAVTGTEPPVSDAQAVKETEVGITHFVSPDLPGFAGVVKKRYTDFLVNEILPSGEVLHLKDTGLPDAFKNAIGETAAAVEPTGRELQNTPTPKPAGEDSKKTDENAETDNCESKAATAETNDAALTPEDRTLLNQFFGSETTPKLLNLHARSLAKLSSRPCELGKVKSVILTDKDQRTSLHQAIRRIFNSSLESSTDNDGTIVVSAASVQQRGGKGKRTRQTAQDRGSAARLPRGKLGWSELGGDYLHFTLYKENKDTMEVISFLSRQLKVGPKVFQFAGTKDRRGATAQRVSVFRIYPDRMTRLNGSLRMAAIGDYEYQKQGLELGQLNGNEFVVTLRDCQFPKGVVGEGGPSEPDTITKVRELVGKSLSDLHERGYFNYYGLQRFGTFATRTDTTGVKMLRGEFKEACESILHYSPIALAAAQDGTSLERNQRPQISTDDILRAKAIHIFQTTGNGRDALEVLPKKFTAESNIIRLLSQRKNDYFGALQSIPRNLRLMYVHAYQSLVWNFAAGERWRLYGGKVVEGDLVLVNDFKDEIKATAQDEVDADGEEIVLPDADDSAAVDDMFERARALSAEEAASGKYTIFDIVLPLPGFDILYPANEMTNFYKEFMGSDKGGNLDPFDMRRSWRDISLSGSYRKLLSRPSADYSFEVRTYRADDEQFVKTDLERLRESKSKGSVDASVEEQLNASEASESPEKLAVILKFQLGASQYATMALRELMKTGGAKEYKPDFSR
ncbi:pseudouridine synthase [Arthroderma uncinatum]|uniref:pseudouridine synthase n=1 Tax=Arthroderma uncinatum TaxID=74035 RepID=UPI00144A8547|nr:pseudouridine synthase [Arthroderma uncinatum]KAF3481072.1 pseudouridine synthase [Arthroderma uncinatum]